VIPRSQDINTVPKYPEDAFGSMSSRFRPFTAPVLQARDLLPTDPEKGREVRKMEDNSWPEPGEAEKWSRPTMGLGNTVWNPRARPMQEYTQELHDRDEGRMKPFIQEHEGLEGADLHAATEKQLSTANIGTVEPGDRVEDGERIIGAHHKDQEDAGQYGVKPEDNRGLGRRFIDAAALAWTAGRGKDQHTMRSVYEGVGDGAPRIQSEAAAKNHEDDGRLLEGGIKQSFLPHGLWSTAAETHEDKGIKKVGRKHEDHPDSNA
jgi:hypothetical protein